VTETISPDRIRRLPKAELHVHLDGSLRPETLIDLGNQDGVDLPRTEASELSEFMHVADARNLVEYLDRFAITLSVMQTEEALERIAYELAEDLAGEGLRYAEIRYCPALHTEQGMTHEAAVEAPLRGLRRAERDHPIRTGLIVCGLRHLPPESATEMAELAVRFRDRGVVAFDLAGAEEGNPPTMFQDAFDIAADASLAITIHAGEAAGAESIREAVHRCRANRIGHGTRLFEDETLLGYLRDFRIPVEICLTSNEQTRAVESVADHPLPRYLEKGLVLGLNTDNRLMSATTLTDEYRVAHEALGLGWDDLVRLARMSFESAFLPWKEKREMLEQFDRVIGEV